MKRLVLPLLITLGALLLLFAWRPAFLFPQHGTRTHLHQFNEGDRAYASTLIDIIQSGGPPKDGIPAIDHPVYETVTLANQWLRDDDVIFGVDYKGHTVAYPQRILVWHEIVNEHIDGQPVSITYCPLTGSAIGYHAPDSDSARPTLGVSGAVVNSNLVMYDRDSDSFWPQILGQGLIGSRTAQVLEEFPVHWTTWKQWRQTHPDTRVLSKQTGFTRAYDDTRDPYGSYLDPNKGYYENEAIWFPILNTDNRFPPKTVVIGLRDAHRNAVAITKESLHDQGTIKTSLGERPISITALPFLDSYEARYTDTNEPLNAFDVMWFAWVAYFPDTALIQ